MLFGIADIIRLLVANKHVEDTEQRQPHIQLTIYTSVNFETIRNDKILTDQADKVN
jgi:hypothetical protein